MDWDNVHKDGYRYVAYLLTDDEKKLFIAALEKQIPKLKKKIEKIQMDPKNEGQVTYSIKIDDLRDEVKQYQNAIDTLKSHSNKPK